MKSVIPTLLLICPVPTACFSLSLFQSFFIQIKGYCFPCPSLMGVFGAELGGMSEYRVGGLSIAFLKMATILRGHKTIHLT